MAERSKAAVSKTVNGISPFGGSNPPLSANVSPGANERAGSFFASSLLSALLFAPFALPKTLPFNRAPATLNPVEYYCKLPPDVADRAVLVLDPMLATGGSAAAITFLKKRGAKNIKMLNIIGSPEGVAKIAETHPDVDVYLGCLDERLNDHGYIVPGLGDAGDRLFGTH